MKLYFCDVFMESQEQHTWYVTLAGQGYTENFQPNRRKKKKKKEHQQF